MMAFLNHNKENNIKKKHCRISQDMTKGKQKTQHFRKR